MMSRRSNKKELQFGTSGLRDLVTNLTDEEIYINTSGFLDYVKHKDGIKEGSSIALAGDYRASTERILKAVARGIRDSSLKVDYCGRIPSPALVYYGMQHSIPGIMVTGSHIPDDRNGVKFAKAAGEILKDEERPILDYVAKARQRIGALSASQKLFAASGGFKTPQLLPVTSSNASAYYINRYLDIFPNGCLSGCRVAVYQHSAVGRDILTTILKRLGATVIAPHESISISFREEVNRDKKTEEIELRSDKFIPVDTEKVTAKTRAILQYLSETYHPDFIVSMDGDSDRPLVADEHGNFIPGDQLGFLCLTYLPLKPEETFVALPVSTNDGVIKKIKSMGYTMSLTKIGSPYIVAQMLLAKSGIYNRRFDDSVGWEANGGFLLGSNLTINNKQFAALPTRDAILPILAVILLAKRKKQPASLLFKSQLLPRYTVSAVIDNQTDGLQHYTAELGQRLIARFSPESTDICQCSLKDDLFYAENWQGEIQKISGEDAPYKNLQTLWQDLERHFNLIGLSGIQSINFIDGLRIAFSTGNVVYHLRPSGNAPEFRSYVTANSQKEAESIIQKRAVLIRSLINLLH
jgi:phosphomannomutase